MENKLRQRIFIGLALFVILFLWGCARKSILLEPTATPSPSQTPAAMTQTQNYYLTWYPLMASGTPNIPRTVSPTRPKITSTPTFQPRDVYDYQGLSRQYLTPFTPWPTSSRQPKVLPTENVENVLSDVVTRKVEPLPPPDESVLFQDVVNQKNGHPHLYINQAAWYLAYLQTATDLMNYVNGDRERYLEIIQSWEPNALQFSTDDWFLKGDFDHNGQPEWLVSIPVRYEPYGHDDPSKCKGYGNFHGYCLRQFYLFQKIGQAYQPLYIYKGNDFAYRSATRLVQVKDLNHDGVDEFVFEDDVCGTACSTYLHIGKWTGRVWEWIGWAQSGLAQVTFADLDGNGTIEISLDYGTYAANRYGHYPLYEHVVDVYGWKNNRFSLVDMIYPETNNVFALLINTGFALEYGNPEQALKFAQPVMDNLGPSCDRMKTYLGIQAMLAYALQGDSQAVYSTLRKLNEYCDIPKNGFIQAARNFWWAYKQSNDPISACEATNRFIENEFIYKYGGEYVTFDRPYEFYPQNCPRR
jgi:hypothetical protein